jgi:7-carboxy-7-deazaguanine synthase
MQLVAVIQKVKELGFKDVCITGGEPLAQNDNTKHLLKELADLGFEVSLETGGSISVAGIDERVKIIMDIKSPDSGEVVNNLWKNIELLKASDELKIVICSREDYLWSRDIIDQYHINEKCQILLSPCSGTLEPRQLAEWILEDHIPARFQMQIHKILWNNQPGK